MLTDEPRGRARRSRRLGALPEPRRDERALRHLDDQLDEIIAQAIEDADLDPTLHDDATIQLIAQRLRKLTLQDTHAIVHIQRDAHKDVQAHPARFQRGKDRASFILAKIHHAALALATRRCQQLGHDMTRVVERAQRSAKLNARAIPAPLVGLLELMAPR